MLRFTVFLLVILWIQLCCPFAFPSVSPLHPSRSLRPRASFHRCTHEELLQISRAVSIVEALAANAADASKTPVQNITENNELLYQFQDYLSPSSTPHEAILAIQLQRLSAHFTARSVHLRTYETIHTDASYPDRLYIHCNDAERRCVEGDHAPAYKMHYRGVLEDEKHVALVCLVSHNRLQHRYANEDSSAARISSLWSCTTNPVF